jgi:hypothetical protein
MSADLLCSATAAAKSRTRNDFCCRNTVIDYMISVLEILLLFIL